MRRVIVENSTLERQPTREFNKIFPRSITHTKTISQKRSKSPLLQDKTNPNPSEIPLVSKTSNSSASSKEKEGGFKFTPTEGFNKFPTFEQKMMDEILDFSKPAPPHLVSPIAAPPTKTVPEAPTRTFEEVTEDVIIYNSDEEEESKDNSSSEYESEEDVDYSGSQNSEFEHDNEHNNQPTNRKTSDVYDIDLPDTNEEYIETLAEILRGAESYSYFQQYLVISNNLVNELYFYEDIQQYKRNNYDKEIASKILDKFIFEEATSPISILKIFFLGFFFIY